jgi:excisionase family DNA binding protein
VTRLTLTVPEFAEALGVSPRLVYERVGRGEIRAVRIGRRVLIPAGVLDELLGGAS